VSAVRAIGCHSQVKGAGGVEGERDLLARSEGCPLRQLPDFERPRSRSSLRVRACARDRGRAGRGCRCHSTVVLRLALSWPELTRADGLDGERSLGAAIARRAIVIRRSFYSPEASAVVSPSWKHAHDDDDALAIVTLKAHTPITKPVGDTHRIRSVA
jgi:hypothetical protein